MIARARLHLVVWSCARLDAVMVRIQHRAERIGDTRLLDLSVRARSGLTVAATSAQVMLALNRVTKR